MLIEYKKHGGMHFVAVGKLRLSFCVARETLARRNARRAATRVALVEYLESGYAVTYAKYADGSFKRMPGRAMYQGCENLPRIPNDVYLSAMRRVLI